MGPQGIGVVVGVGVALIGSLFYFLYQGRTRYRTYNSNATGDNFNIYRESRCSVCLESMTSSNEAIINCGHTICRDCLIELERHRTYFSSSVCPLCRTPIRAG